MLSSLPKKNAIFILFVFIIGSINAQPTFQKSYGSVSGFLLDMFSTIDGGTIFLSVGALTKIDCSGNIVWAKELNLAPTGIKNTGSIIETLEGDIMATYIVPQLSGAINKPNIGIIKFDALGNLIWQKQYGNINLRENPSAIISTQDGGFLVSGGISRTPTSSSSEVLDFYFVKIDEDGNLLWTKTFGEDYRNNRIQASIEDTNGNTIHIGINEDVINVEISTGFIVKLNPNGDVIYYKEMINLFDKSFPRDLVNTPNDNQLIVGSLIKNDTLFNSFLMKIDSNGQIIYTKNLETYSMGDSHTGQAIISLQNGGYAIGGNVRGFPQFTNNNPSSFLTSISILDENENYSSAKLYEYHKLIFTYSSNFYHLKPRIDVGFQLGFSNFPNEGLLQRKLTVIRLDEFFSSGCNDHDVTEEYFLTEDLGWTTENIPYITSSTGVQINHTSQFETFQYDTITTYCQNIAQANFYFENPCSIGMTTFIDLSLGNIISREWNFNNGAVITNEENPNFEFPSTGVFPIQLIVSDGCVTDTLSREVEILPTFFSVDDITVCSGRPIYFHNNVFTETVDETQTFIYIDTLTNYLGCDSIVALTALVEPCGCELVFPNVFTPDNDGINDVFYPIIECDFMVENYRLLIFNRWGQLVFESQNPTEQWNGTYKGKTLPMDVLIYKVQYDVKDEDGIDNQQVNQVGDITLIR